MSSMPCQLCQEWLVPFIDNQIEDSAVFNEIAYHLQDCHECRTQLELERRTIDGQTQIEIETSHEIRRDFPLE